MFFFLLACWFSFHPFHPFLTLFKKDIMFSCLQKNDRFLSLNSHREKGEVPFSGDLT